MFDFSGFDLGSPISSFGAWGLGNPALPGTVATSGGQTTGIGVGTPWYQSLATLGLDGFKSWLNFDLAQQQVAKGQLPSVAPGGGTVLSTSIGSSTIVYLVLLAVVAFVLIKALR